MDSTTAVEANFNSSTSEPGRERLFRWADYLVFALSLAIPLAIGVFFFFYKRKEQQGTENFLVGDRSINFVAVALSILASLLNGIFVIGTPAEMHYYGVEISYMVIGLLIAIAITAHLFVPTYQSMRFTSAYEYVEKRYNYPTRVVASILFCLSVIIFLAVVLYVPALAFAQVTKLNIYITITVTGAICTIYTTIGGMKAVVWTDAVQMVILLIGLIAVAGLGSYKVGGGQVVWETAVETFRINYDDFRVDPRIRHTFWTQTIGQGFTFVGLLVSNQMMVQRYMSVATRWQAQAALYIAVLMFIPLVMLIVFIGLALHATYNKCDPLIAKQIRTGDQITPFYIVDILGEYPGAPGLITASVFAAALSSVSSVINALAAVCLEDFIVPAVWYFKKEKLAERVKRIIAVVIVIFFGAVTIGLSFVASYFTDKVIQATSTIWGVIGGPLAGIFIMGFFVPFGNSAGAICGMLGGLTFSLWVSIGNIIYAPPTPTLPVGVCVGNRTIILPVHNPNNTVETFPLMDLYTVSYAWYGLIGIGSSFIIGVVVSLLTCGCRRSHISSLDRTLMNVPRCCLPPAFTPTDTKVDEFDSTIIEVSYQKTAIFGAENKEDVFISERRELENTSAKYLGKTASQPNGGGVHDNVALQEVTANGKLPNGAVETFSPPSAADDRMKEQAAAKVYDNVAFDHDVRI
jgi:SSS family transporter